MIGADSVGRGNLCGQMEKLSGKRPDGRPSPLLGPQTKEDVALGCEGGFVRTIVLTGTNWSSNFRALRGEALLREMLGQSYKVIADRLVRFVPRHGKDPVTGREIAARLEGLRATTVEDLLFAFGFEKIVVRDLDTDADYLEWALTGIGEPRK